MPIDFRNTNTLWASILVETLARLGVTMAIACPGSRSTPLTVAVAQHPDITAIPILDERSAAFFALGRSRATRQPTLLICTSGTAGANFYPAIIEARASRIPLIVITCDRPPELRDCNAGQTIDQQKLYGTYPNWYTELAVPSTQRPMLDYLRQTVVHAWERSLYPVAGPVHLNQPFRDPLAPVTVKEVELLGKYFNAATFLASLEPPPEFPRPTVAIPSSLLADVQQSDRPLLIAGIDDPEEPDTYCNAIAQLSDQLQAPILAEALSPVRHRLNHHPNLITTYDGILRHPDWSDTLKSTLVIRIGEMPTSKVLRQWLTAHQPLQWVIHPSDRNVDPSHGHTCHLRCAVTQLPDALADIASDRPSSPFYLEQWRSHETQVRQYLKQTFTQTTDRIESKWAWVLGQSLPPDTPIAIANSMPVRDWEWFCPPNDKRYRILFNRGANGIDGTLSTALGSGYGTQSVLVTGDLACLHDTNGFLIRPHWRGHLTILLINNNGGGIFGLLPIAQFDPPFEEFFATPQSVDISTLCAAYGIEHHPIQSWEQLRSLLNPLPQEGIRVLELTSDRATDMAWRQSVWQWLEDR
jgi:2-succinyl-5-enolpyruvyl-6-hydroxy-3-cyclohexene-1-carboxylate synthase